MPVANSLPTVPFAGGAQANTFQNPNFLGELFNISPRETPFLSLIGGLNGGKSVMTKDFTWQLEADEGDANGAPAGIAEGRDPVYSTVGRGEMNNIVQIFQYGFGITYTRLAATQQLGPQPAANSDDVTGGVHPIAGSNAITNEVARQTSLKLARMSKDVEKAFLNGTFRRPLTAVEDGVDGGAGASSRQTQGILGAILASQKDKGAGALDIGTNDPIADLQALLLIMYTNGHAPLGPSTIIMAAPADKVLLTAAAVTQNYLVSPRERFIAGFRLEHIVTDFGEFPIVMNRWMTPGEVLVVDLSVCRPVTLPIPGKGSVFVEELAQTGAAQNWQLYGELGLEYGPPHFHGSMDSALWT